MKRRFAAVSMVWFAIVLSFGAVQAIESQPEFRLTDPDGFFLEFSGRLNHTLTDEQKVVIANGITDGRWNTMFDNSVTLLGFFEAVTTELGIGVPEFELETIEQEFLDMVTAYEPDLHLPAGDDQQPEQTMLPPAIFFSNNPLHFFEGEILVHTIFVNVGTSEVWSADDRSDVLYKLDDAEVFFGENAPDDINLSFTNTTDIVTVDDRPVDNMPEDCSPGSVPDWMDQAAEQLGYSDDPEQGGDGDGMALDEMAQDYHDIFGGDQYVLLFVPKEVGRSYACSSLPYAVTYFYRKNMFGLTVQRGWESYAHEMGHLGGACDEYEEGGFCTCTEIDDNDNCISGIDCGECNNTYLAFRAWAENGNCELTSCNQSPVDCIMYEADDAVCDFTKTQWGWEDHDMDGLRDAVDDWPQLNVAYDASGLPQNVTVGETVTFSLTVTNISVDDATINNLWMGLDIYLDNGTKVENTLTPIADDETGHVGLIDFGTAQGQELTIGESRTFEATYTFSTSVSGHVYQPGDALEYRFVAWEGGYPGAVGVIMGWPTSGWINQLQNQSLEIAAPPSTIPHAVLQGLYWLQERQVVTGAVQVDTDSPTGSEATESDAVILDMSRDVAALGSWRYGSSSNAGITALALQAFLNAGVTVNDPVFGSTVESAINYLLAVQVAGGFHMGGIANSQYGYETAMATVALKSALKTGLPPGHPLRGPVEAAANLALGYYTTDFQDSWPSISWRYSRSWTDTYGERNNGDMSINQWVFLALDAMSYEEKGVWQKIYNYLNAYKCRSGDQSRIGYFRTDCNGRARGNTLAGIWGLVLANHHGVSGASNLADEMFNYIDDYCGVNRLISFPNVTSYAVYSGAGYYYYIYELSKALEMSGKTQFCSGENWGEIMYDRLEGQHLESASGYYYWTTGHRDPYDNYYIASGGMGTDGHTALALLAMEAAKGVIPPGSKLKVKLRRFGPARDINGAYLRLYDEEGRYAGPDENGDWYSDIPLGVWNSTSDYQEFELSLTEAERVGVEIHNDGPDTFDWELCLEVYTPDQIDPVDFVCFTGSVLPGRPLGTESTVDAVGGLSVRAPQPILLPCPEVVPEAFAFSPLTNDTTFQFEFTISEVCDATDLTNIDIFASDLVTAHDDTIPKANFTFTPSHIDILPAGGSIVVAGTLTIPSAALLDLEDAGQFVGVITIEAGQLTRSITVVAHSCSPNLANFILPGPLHTVYVNQPDSIKYEDIFGDPVLSEQMTPYIYVDGFDETHTADNIDLATVRINETIEPVATAIVEAIPLFEGRRVLQVAYPISEFILYYGWVTDTVLADYTIDGKFTDGTPFMACGDIPIIGHISGDITADGVADISDLTGFISYLFQGQEIEGELLAADVNHDGSIDISDLALMIAHLFSSATGDSTAG